MKRLARYLVGIVNGEKKPKIWLLIVIIAVTSSVHPSYILISRGLPLANKAPVLVQQLVEKNVPEDLEIKITNGRVSINKPEPYILTLDMNDLDELQAIVSGLPSTPSKTKISRFRVLVIDTKARIQDYNHYQTFALLTADSLVTTSKGDLSVSSLADSPDRVINRAKVQELVNVLVSQRLWAIIRIGLLSSPVLLTLGKMTYVVICMLYMGFLFWCMGRIMRCNPGWKQLCRLFIVLTFVPSLLQAGLGWAGDRWSVILTTFIGSVELLMELVITYFVLKAYTHAKRTA